MKKSSLYVAFAVALLSLLAWAGVAYFASYIEQSSTERVSQIQDSARQSNQDVQAQATHTLLKDTTDTRAQLDTLLNVDPASLSGIISAVGKSAGASIGISDALSDGSLSSGGMGTSNSFGFAVSAKGTYSSVVRVAQLLEMLPIPSSIEGITFTRVEDTPGAPANTAPWQVVIRVKVLSKPIQ